MEHREWVRNHKYEGFVVARFEGDLHGHRQPLVAVQTMNGLVALPARAVIPVDKDYIIRQASLNLEAVVRAMQEGGLSFADMQMAWEAALEHVQAAQSQP